MLRLVNSLLVVGFFLGACAAPEEPAALKSASTSDESTKASKTKASALPVNYGGASIGDEDMKTAVKKCVDKGKFFDRVSGGRGACTDFNLAAVACADATITSIMDDRDKASYAEMKTGALAGYTLDQCLDCSSPVGNVLCEGTKDEKIKDPGVRLFHVKVNGTSIDLRTVFIFK